MSVTELSRALALDKGAVSRLLKRGMPCSSAAAADAWRATNAPPRQRKRNQTPGASATPKATPTEPTDSIDPSATGDDSPQESVRRARLAEKIGYNELTICKRDGGSVDDMRKASALYIASRGNRQRAERDFLEYQTSAGTLMFADEARALSTRGHEIVADLLRTGPKTLATRLYGMPMKSIEKTLADWLDGIAEHLRKSF